MHVHPGRHSCDKPPVRAQLVRCEEGGYLCHSCPLSLKRLLSAKPTLSALTSVLAEAGGSCSILSSGMRHLLIYRSTSVLVTGMNCPPIPYSPRFAAQNLHLAPQIVFYSLSFFPFCSRAVPCRTNRNEGTTTRNNPIKLLSASYNHATVELEPIRCFILAIQSQDRHSKKKQE